MKRTLLLVFVMAIVGFSASPVYAGPYASLNLGAGYVKDLNITGGDEKAELSFDPGYSISGAFGNSYNKVTRAEVEFSYLKSDLDEVSLVGFGSAPLDGDGTITTLMFNGYYDFMPEYFVSPFLGAGLGYARAELDILGISEDNDLFAGQVMAGASFTLTEQLKFDLQYRYFATEDMDFEEGVKVDSINIHNFLIGLRYGF